MGVIGFVVMLGGVLLAVTPGRGPGRVRMDPDRPAKATASNSTSFMDRMNDRWDKRQGER